MKKRKIRLTAMIMKLFRNVIAIYGEVFEERVIKRPPVKRINDSQFGEFIILVG